MNATQKAAILRANGYERAKTTTGIWTWWTNGMAVLGDSESRSDATHAAYQHYLDNQAPVVESAIEAPAMQSKYPQSDFPTTLEFSGITLEVTDTGRIPVLDASHDFKSLNCCIYQRVSYRDLSNGNVWIVEAIAFEQGSRVHKFLYMNGKLFKASDSLKHADDNALFNHVVSSEKAVMYMLNHAESIVKNMAFNARQAFSAEYNVWLDSLNQVKV